MVNQACWMLAVRDLDGPKPVSWTRLQEQWRLSSDGLLPILPLLIAGLVLVTVLLVVRSGLLQRFWHGRYVPVKTFLDAAGGWRLASSDKWFVVRIARRLGLPGPLALLVSPETFDHHTRAYQGSVDRQTRNRLDARIARIRHAAFGDHSDHAAHVRVKIPPADVGTFTQRLSSLAAGPGHHVFQIVTSYVHRSQGFASVGGGGPCLLLEQALDGRQRSATITCCAPRSGESATGSRQLQLRVPHATEAGQLLEAMGFAAWRRYEKQRSGWSWHGCHIYIDTLPLLGSFLTLEGPSQEAVSVVLHQLHLDSMPQVDSDDTVLLGAYLTQHGVRDEYIPLGSGASHGPHIHATHH